MLTGIRLQAIPTDAQKLKLSQWMGCARVIWNAKCDEHRYMRAYARKFHPLGTWAPIDQTFSQFKDSDLSPWLSDCPSQILRNAAVGWFRTCQGFMKGRNGRPKRKRKTDRGSVHLTRELFRFEKGPDGRLRLFIGTKTNNVGHLEFRAHRPFGTPNSIRIVKEAGKYFVSFSYEDGKAEPRQTDFPVFASPEERLEWLRSQGREWLEAHVQGHDRGIAVPVQSGDEVHDFEPEQKRSIRRQGKKVKRLQRQLARQDKGSKRRARTKFRLARAHLKDRNVRKDFCHKTSRRIVDSADVNVFEMLKLKNMVRRPKAVRDGNGKFLPNGARAKAGLNRGLLSKGLGMVVDFARYKSDRAGKILLLVDPKHTSQECASCGHVDPDSRRTQARFECTACGHRDNADRNASIVIGKRAVELILDSGTELSERGFLSKPTQPADTGRGAAGKTGQAEAFPARGVEASKEKGETAPVREAA